MKSQRQESKCSNDTADLTAMLTELQKTSEQRFREATEFKPGELTAEEEGLAKEHNLTALNYIPHKTLAKHEQALAEYKARMERRSEILSRPNTDPARIELVRREHTERFRKAVDDRFDGFGYGIFLFLIAGVTWLLAQDHGWPIGVFCLLLMVAILELGYRLSSRK